MPLFVNNEWFNPRLPLETQPSAHKDYKKTYDRFVEEVRSFKSPVTLKIRRANKIRTDSKGTPLPPPSDNLSWKSVVNTASGSETWVYQESIPEKKDGEYRFRKMGEWVRGSLVIHPSRQMDKLFYFMRKSPYINRTLIHYDPAAEAQRKVLTKQLEAELYFHIYNRDSDLVKEPNRLRDIAKSWGVKKVSELSIPEIQEELFSKVTSGDDRRTKGIKAFIDSVGDKSKISREARIREAIEKDVISLNDMEMAWKFKSRGKETAEICKVESSDKGKEISVLMDYLSRHPIDENRILHAVKTGKLSKFTSEDVESLEWTELTRECQVAGISYAGKKKEKIYEELREWFRFLEK